jgi:hypothetical protein
MARSHLIIITLLYGIVAAISFQQYGVKYVNDSHRYLEYANTLAHGLYFDPHNFWYISYAFFLLIVRTVSTSYLLIIVIQYLISYLAVLSVYQSTYFLFQNSRSSLVASCLYILFYELMVWNSYILTESLYASFMCFSLHSLLWYQNKPSTPRLFVMGGIILFTAMIKPTGIALVGALVAVGIYILSKRIKALLAKILVMLTLITAFAIIIDKMLTTYLIMENYQLGEVIYGLTTLPHHTQYSSLLVTPPENIYVPEEGTRPLLKVIYFITHHPWYWTKLFFTKLFFFLGHVRPFWSTAHNLFSVLFLVPVYILAGRTLIKRVIPFHHSIFTITFISIHVLSVCITSEDWDGRFLVPLLPPLIMLSSHSFIDIIPFLPRVRPLHLP